MNKDIAKLRYKDVFRPDVINNSQWDFLATHVPMKNLYVTDRAEVSDQDKRHTMTEEEVYDLFLTSRNEDQFVLVKGASGAGKSHLIRWFDTMLELRRPESEIVLFIRRADNTLKSTIRQLIDLPEVKNLPNRELYKKLASASTTIPELELKNTIYYWFINLIESDNGKANNGDERIISNVDRKHLIALLQNSTFKERAMEEGGPIDRIYSKFAENKTSGINDEAAEFRLVDFEVDSEFRTKLINAGADEKARKIADKMVDNEVFVKRIVDYINLFVEKVVQRCAGLEPGDLGKVIEEIRQELYKQGKSITVLIEDITAASGVDDSLLDALLTDRSGYPDKNMCRINSIVGSTDGYYIDKFRTNTKGRIKYFINVPDEMFNGDTAGLVEFFARYLNTVSLDEKTIRNWVDTKAIDENYPIHTVTIGKGWGEYKLGDKEINLFPFSQHAIIFLYKKQDVNRRNPRALMREIIEPYLNDALEDLSIYPVRRTSLEGVNPSLQNTIYNRNDLDDYTKIRLAQFMYIWGNGTDGIYEENQIRYIGGIPEYVYNELGLPIINGKVIEKPEEKPTSVILDVKPREKTNPAIKSLITENEQVIIALKEVDKWIEQKDYKLSIGATTKNVRALNDARKNINDYLYSVIDWTSEGVPIDAMTKIRDNQGKFLVAFERQTTKSDAVVTLSASIESRKIIEAFVRWSEVGNKSWSFPRATDYLYRVQRWTERIKPTIIHAVMHYNGKAVDYFSYAVAAEYYRLILNGYCKTYQSPQNFVPELLLQKNPTVQSDNGHTKTWNDLVKITNGSDGNDNRNCVLQYYNLPQGTAINSTNYEYDYVSFNKSVRRVINTGLKYTDEELQLDDPVRKRRLASEYLKKIMDRIETVVEDERKVIRDKLDVIKQLINIEEIDEEDDIKDIINEIKKFYNQAQASHASVAVHYDSTLVNNCQKNAGSIVSAIKVALQLQKIEDPVESLIRLSKDPLLGMSSFVGLLMMVNDDVIKANQEITNRMKNKSSDEDESNKTEYAKELEQIKKCKEILEEVKKNHVN